MALTMYLWFEGGPKGTATAKEVSGKNAIGILSYQHETTHPPAQSSSGQVSATPQGQPKFGDFKITKYVDQMTPGLALACAGGANIKKATVGVFIAQEKDAASTPLLVMKYELESVIVTSIEAGSKGVDLPVETVTFAFNKITWTSNNMDNKTGAGAGNFSNNWDIDLNTGA